MNAWRQASQPWDQSVFFNYLDFYHNSEENPALRAEYLLHDGRERSEGLEREAGGSSFAPIFHREESGQPSTLNPNP
jgi:hypothetical protein